MAHGDTEVVYCVGSWIVRFEGSDRVEAVFEDQTEAWRCAEKLAWQMGGFPHLKIDEEQSRVSVS